MLKKIVVELKWLSGDGESIPFPTWESKNMLDFLSMKFGILHPTSWSFIFIGWKVKTRLVDQREASIGRFLHASNDKSSRKSVV